MASLFKPWLWPSTRRGDGLWNVRLGRVVHWISLVFAAGSIVLGLGLYGESESNASRSAADIAAWHHRHPHGAPPATFDDMDNPAYQYDPAPYPQQGYPIYVLIGSLCAFGFAITGRGARYILGGE